MLSPGGPRDGEERANEGRPDHHRGVATSTSGCRHGVPRRPPAHGVAAVTAPFPAATAGATALGALGGPSPPPTRPSGCAGHRSGAADPGDARPARRGLPRAGAAAYRGRHRRRIGQQLPGAAGIAFISGTVERTDRKTGETRVLPYLFNDMRFMQVVFRGPTVTNAMPRSPSFELTSTSLPVREAHRSTTSTRASPSPVCSGPPSFRPTAFTSTRPALGDTRGPPPRPEGLHRLGKRPVRGHAGDTGASVVHGRMDRRRPARLSTTRSRITGLSSAAPGPRWSGRQARSTTTSSRHRLTRRPPTPPSSARRPTARTTDRERAHSRSTRPPRGQHPAPPTIRRGRAPRVHADRARCALPTRRRSALAFGVRNGVYRLPYLPASSRFEHAGVGGRTWRRQ